MPQVNVDKDIKPLITEMDREHMEFMFDLWSYKDVKDNADANKRDAVLDLLIAFDAQRFYEQGNYYNRVGPSTVGHFDDDEDVGGRRPRTAD